MAAVGGLFLIVRRSLRQHALSTAVTVMSTALASGLVMAVFSIQAQSREAFSGGQSGFDAVLGARGSQLQLVLNSVFHLETSPGNIPWSLYQEVKALPQVSLAVPIAVGDNYQGFRIVGTTLDMFTELEYRKGKKYAAADGRILDTGRREALVGSFAAQRTGVQVGDTINPYHGLIFDENTKHEEEYTVVGILEPTNTPADRVIWIPIEGLFRMTGHVLRGTGTEYTAQAGQAIPDAHKEVSAVLLKFKDAQSGFTLDQQINKQGRVATLAWPIGRVMADLFERIGWMSRVLELVAYLVVMVSGGAILAAIYNSINERRREFAILRALGARKTTVFSAIVLESTAIATLGGLLGYFVYAAILGVAASVVRAQTGVALDMFYWHPSLLGALIGMIGVGAAAGVIPAFKAYSTDVASNLTPSA